MAAVCCNAQTTFTQHLTRHVAGEGQVTLHHDAEIEALVNGRSHATAHRGHVASHDSIAPDAETAATALEHGRRTKAIGYRIQVYAGGNNRSAKQEAQRMGSLVRSMFTDVPVYTNFISPRWVCRVGDFKTYEEANDLLKQMQETHRFNEASIVKTQIVVYK